MNTSEHSVDTGSGGNTSNPRARKWCMTLNNYTAEELDSIKRYFQTQKHWIIAKEGKNATPHLQGYFEAKNPVSFKTLRNLCGRAHWEITKGNTEQNRQYCMKEGNYETNIPLPLEERLLNRYASVEWKDWQQEILDILETEPDARTIHCVVDRKGNSGKSFLCKYIDLKYDVIIASGKKNDIFNQVKMYMDEGKEPRIVLLDIPRSQDKISWGAIEALKNGHIYSGKYEGGKLIFDYVHVIIFMNYEPPKHEMSEDRWKIHYI